MKRFVLNTNNGRVFPWNDSFKEHRFMREISEAEFNQRKNMPPPDEKPAFKVSVVTQEEIAAAGKDVANEPIEASDSPEPVEEQKVPEIAPADTGGTDDSADVPGAEKEEGETGEEDGEADLSLSLTPEQAAEMEKTIHSERKPNAATMAKYAHLTRDNVTLLNLNDVPDEDLQDFSRQVMGNNPSAYEEASVTRNRLIAAIARIESRRATKEFKETRAKKATVRKTTSRKTATKAKTTKTAKTKKTD